MNYNMQLEAVGHSVEENELSVHESSICSLIYSFNKFLLSLYSMPGPRLGPRDTARNKAQILIPKFMVQQKKMTCKPLSPINHLKADKEWLQLPFTAYESHWAPFVEDTGLQGCCAPQGQ